MAKIPILIYSMPRGDSRTLPLAVPTSVYTTGASIFFGMKATIDADVTDANAYAKKTLTDADIVSQNANTVNYVLTLNPSDTTGVPPNTYFAELEYVSADKLTVISYPDPDIMIFQIVISGDVNRRIT